MWDMKELDSKIGRGDEPVGHERTWQQNWQGLKLRTMSELGSIIGRG